MKHRSGTLLAVLAGTFLFAQEASAQMRWEKERWSCTGRHNQKRVSAQLMNIPAGRSWEAACAGQTTGPYGIRKKPDECLNNAGMWGVWYVSSSADCAPKVSWGGENKACSGPWRSTVSARLWGIRPGESWEVRCAATVASGPVSTRYRGLGVVGAPQRCVKGTLNEGIWGEWDVVNDRDCADGRFAQFPFQVFNNSTADVFASVMWIHGDTIVTQGSGRIKAGGSSKFSIAGIDCDPAKLRDMLAGGDPMANLVKNSNVTDSCYGQHFQVYFWNSEANFVGYAAEQVAVALPFVLAGGVLDAFTRALTKGAVKLPGVAEAAQFAADKWRLLRDPNSRLSTWGVHGWAHNVPQQNASVYYWGRGLAQDVALDSAKIGTPVHPNQRSPRFVYELPVGDSTPTIMQTRLCTDVC